MRIVYTYFEYMYTVDIRACYNSPTHISDTHTNSASLHNPMQIDELYNESALKILSHFILTFSRR